MDNEPTPQAQDSEPSAIAPPELLHLNALTHDISAYNQQFSMGSMMFRVIKNAIDTQEMEETLSGETQLANESAGQVLTADSLAAIHGMILGQVGLGLEQVSGKAFTMYYGGGQAGNGELRVNVTDGHRFIAFLQGLTHEQVEAAGANVSFASLCEALSQQVLDNYDFNAMKPEALELVGRLGRILGEFQRLDIQGAGVNRLSTILTHAQQGDLREYIAIERLGLLQEPDKGFGPANWQQDITPERLEGRWIGALQALQMAAQNPKAALLHRHLRAHLQSSVNHAQAFLQAHPNYYPVGQMAEITRILEQARQNL